MAVTRTSLAQAIANAHDLFFTLTSNAGATVGGLCKVNNEWSTIVETVGTTGVKVRHRGGNGTVAKAHAILSPVVLCLASDLADKVVPTPDTDPDVVNYGADGAVALPRLLKTVAYINKATAAALTLASPDAAVPDGAEIEFISVSGAAHTLTHTPGFAGNTTSSDVATWATTRGGILVIKAVNGVWTVKSAAGVTIA